MATSKRPSGTFLTNQRRKLGAQQAGRRAATPPTTKAFPPRGGTSAGNGKAVAQRTATAVGQRARLDVARLKGLGRYLQHQGNQADKQIPQRDSPVVTPPNVMAKSSSRPKVGPRRQIAGSTAGESRVGSSSAPYGQGAVRRVSVTDVSGPKALPPGKSNKALPESTRLSAAKSKLDNAAKGSTGPNRVGRPSAPKALAPSARLSAAKAKLDSAAKGTASSNVRVGQPNSPKALPPGSKGGALATRPKGGPGKGLIGGLFDAGVRIGSGQDAGKAITEATGGNIGARIGSSIPGNPIIKALGGLTGYAIGSGGAGKALDMVRDNMILSDRPSSSSSSSSSSKSKGKAGPPVPNRPKQASARPSAAPASAPQAPSRPPQQESRPTMRKPISSASGSAPAKATAAPASRPSAAPSPQPQQSDTPKLNIPTSTQSQGSNGSEWTPPNDPSMYSTDNKRVRFNKAFVDKLPDMSMYDRKKKKG